MTRDIADDTAVAARQRKDRREQPFCMALKFPDDAELCLDCPSAAGTLQMSVLNMTSHRLSY